jgi:hypothetical protein
MQPCNAPQNPIDAKAGRAINENPHVTFHPFRDNSEEQIRALIDRTKREIDPLNNED